MLKSIVNHYMQSQWVNCHRDLGFYAAREEILSYGKIMPYEPGSTTLKYVYKDAELNNPYQIPVIADSNGYFGKIYLDGEYSLPFTDKNGVFLAIVTTGPGFDIEA